MQRLTAVEYDELVRDARMLSADEHGPKVLLRTDDMVIKVFRRKRWLSSALLWPYACRFAKASRELAARAVPAVKVEQCARVSHIQRDLVTYRRLPGMSIREAIAGDAGHIERVLSALAQFLAMLHERGVYFRAAHFGNVLVSPATDGSTIDLALIDLSETRFRSGPLPPAMRARNFRPFTRCPEDLAAVQDFGIGRFVRQYTDATKLGQSQMRAFREALRRVHPAFAPA